GCIHTCQGLELETIGVIIGPDLAVRDGEVVTVPSARALTDQSLKGYKVGLICDPAGFSARRTRSSATPTAL
ncbi:MAG: DNA/RNA helicase domain-containing protein, partial [Cyanobacteriota bacterium]